MTQDKKLREEFEKEFPEDDCYVGWYEPREHTQMKGIADYWLKVLHHEREQLIAEVEKMGNKKTDTFEHFIEIRQEEILQNGIAEYDRKVGYNEAKLDFISLLKN